jgi:hypothetical protein
MRFKEWLLNEDDFRTGSKLGLYPAIEDAYGQYPPLYGIPKAADLITYSYIQYGKNGPPGKNGIIRYKDDDQRHRQHFYKGRQTAIQQMDQNW